MSVDYERQEFYKRFDAAVAGLPAELRNRVDMPLTEVNPHTGLMTLVDKRLRPIATVGELDGKVTLVQEETQKAPEPKKPAKHYVTKDDLLRTARKIMGAVRERIEATESQAGELVESLDDRLKSIEGERVSKALDAEAIETMAEMAERLDRLETTLQEIADGGFKYRGYWRDGMKAKRGDAFTHDGSLWWAVRTTSDRPCNESVDWHIAARKGRDAK